MPNFDSDWDIEELDPPDPWTVHDANDLAHMPVPEPIIWREGDKYAPVVREGECCVLSAEGGLGKSALSLELALGAAYAARISEVDHSVCGLTIRGGPVLIASYEASAADVAADLRGIMASRANPKLPVSPEIKLPPGLWVSDLPQPLFEPSLEGRGPIAPSKYWEGFCHRVRQLRPVLTIIDVARSALVRAHQSDSSAVREFVGALGNLAGEVSGAMLIVSHDTKTGRTEARQGRDPGAGAVSGSHEWHDRARGVMLMMGIPGQPDYRILQVIKANRGPRDWGVILNARWGVRAADNLPSPFGGLERGRHICMEYPDGRLASGGDVRAAYKALQTDEA